jgi:hypothetical protein
MNYADHVQAQLRRSVLCHLLQQSDGTLNEHLIHARLEDEAFYVDTLERRAHIAYLADKGCINARFIGDVMIVQLTDVGRLVALGKRVVDGIACPALPVAKSVSNG